MSFEVVGVKLVAEGEQQFNAALDSADKAVKGFGDTADKTFKQLPSLSDIAVGALHKIGEVAVSAFMEAGRAAVSFVGDSISAAGDFEAGMNRFAAVAGGALQESGLAIEDFRDQFIQIGKELPVSTSEVQDAAIEMVKGGIEPATIAAGGLRQVIQFAAAADLDLAEASTIAAKAIGGWVDQAASAQEKADFLTHSTDLLSKAANASTVDVSDLALGLYNVQGTAKLAGVSFDETVTALAQLAPSFSSSADAGTSFKAFLGRLQPTTKPAIEAMKGLGLYTDEAGSAFYDAQGNFIGMEAVAGKLKDATKNLTEAQRVQVLQTIFGQDAIRVAAVLSEQGAEGYNNMADALAKQNSVADMAAQKQAGFNTALDNFKGSVEALQITIGSYLLPILTDLFNNYLAPGINILTDLAGALFGDDEAFNRLSGTMQGVVLSIEGFIAGVQSAWAIMQPVVDFVGENLIPILSGLAAALLTVVVPAFVAWAGAASAAAVATITALAPVILPIVAIGAAVAVLVKIWESDWLGIRTAVTDFWNKYGQPIFNSLVDWLSVTIPAGIATLTNFWNNTLLPAITAVWNFISTKLIPLFMAVVNVHMAVMEVAIKELAGFWNDTLYPAIEKVYNWFDQNINPVLVTVGEKMGIVGGVIRETLGPAFEWLSNNILAPVVNWFGSISDSIQRAINWLNNLADTIRNLPSLPDPFVGHSPPPMAKWFASIGAGAEMASIGMNTMGASIRTMPASPMALMAGASSNTTTYNQPRNVNLNYHTTYAPNVDTSMALANALI